MTPSNVTPFLQTTDGFFSEPECDLPVFKKAYVKGNRLSKSLPKNSHTLKNSTMTSGSMSPPKTRGVSRDRGSKTISHEKKKTKPKVQNYVGSLRVR